MNNRNNSNMNLRVTDAHVHFWDIGQLTYPWLDEVPAIKKTFDIADYQKTTENLNIDNMVFVQCECLPNQYLHEIAYVTNQAALDQRLKGIVAWVPLERGDAEEYLYPVSTNALVKGVRRLEETPSSLYSNPFFINNLALLNQYGLSFDICLKSQQLPAAIRMVDKQPDVHYMLDHLGKPDIKNKEFTLWADHIRILAQNPKVYCKVSGMLTEADLQNWTLDDLRPYVDYVAEQFGPDRLVYGGDWPVVTLAGTYTGWLEALLLLIDGFSEKDQRKLLSENGNRFYRLS